MKKPNQALKSVKGPENTFDLIPKWARTLPLGIFHGIFIEPFPPSTKKIPISKLIFNTLLWAWGAETHPGKYVSLRPDNSFDLTPKWARNLPFGIVHGIFKVPPPQKKKNSNIKIDI